MKEFCEAHAHATRNGRNKFLVPILFGEIDIEALDIDLKLYLENHTYIECKSMVDILFLNKMSFSNNLLYCTSL